MRGSLPDKSRAALEGFIQVAQGDTGQSRMVANFLLAGGHQYADAMGYGKHFEAIVRVWRPAGEASERTETL